MRNAFASARSRDSHSPAGHPRDNARLHTLRLALEILEFVDRNPVCTIAEVRNGIETRVHYRTILRSLTALEAIGAVESRLMESEFFKGHWHKVFESTGKFSLASANQKGGVR